MIIINCLYIYLLIGVAFAFYFLTNGVKKIHHDIRGGGWGLVLLLIPATILLWPFLLERIKQKQ